MSTNTSSATPPAGGPDAGTTGPDGSSEDSLKWFARHEQLSEKQRTSWDTVEKSFRFAPRPYRWREIVLGVGVLYGGFIGVPAAAGIWAAVKIWHQVHHG
jgi:hypothetical protein